MVGFLTYSLAGETRALYLPGPTTAGHYQIEIECKACHSEVFADQQAIQSACVRCHGEELDMAEDSHPEAKFRDPRNASRVEVLDARYCVTCHKEHRPELISPMGLSLPEDYCYRCHEDIADERPTHKGLPFDGCQDAGCHNFHDNRALYEDFLIKHLDEPTLLSEPKNPSLTHSWDAKQPLAAADADAPAAFRLAPEELAAWEKSAHGRAGTNCSDCHETDADFREAVSGERCGECHQHERRTYLQGRHGMREAAGLPPMVVADARQPMRADARERTLGCTSCHGAHSFDTRRAAVDGCLECHADEHSLNYKRSQHFALFVQDARGESGASCATCHLPRLKDGETLHVQHNQNDTLRPNEKMVRAVCMNCHGLEFSLDALASSEQVTRNFTGVPAKNVPSLDWARGRLH